jgi:hypothetical protein
MFQIFVIMSINDSGINLKKISGKIILRSSFLCPIRIEEVPIIVIRIIVLFKSKQMINGYCKSNADIINEKCFTIRITEERFKIIKLTLNL